MFILDRTIWTYLAIWSEYREFQALEMVSIIMLKVYRVMERVWRFNDGPSPDEAIVARFTRLQPVSGLAYRSLPEVAMDGLWDLRHF